MLSDGFVMASSIPSLGSIYVSQAMYLMERHAFENKFICESTTLSICILP